MVDTPKTFLILIVALILSISTISFATKRYVKEVEEQSTFVITLNKAKGNVPPPAPEGAGGVSPVSGNSTYEPPTTSITPITQIDYIIHYTTSGFVPSSVRVKAGASVRFLNDSNASMLITAARSSSSNDYSELNQGKSVGRGDFYDFVFNRKGTFIYYNNNNKAHSGVISVE